MNDLHDSRNSRIQQRAGRHNQHEHTLFTHWTVVLILVLMVAALPAMAQPKQRAVAKPDPAALLNLAARQPMLAERITKAYTMLGQKVLDRRARGQLDEALGEFTTSLKVLQSSAPNAEVKENYELLEQLFDEYKTLTAKPATLETAKVLAEQNEELVWIATKGANLLGGQSKSARNGLIARAGELRTLTQRIAKLYFFRSWGIRGEVLANDLKKAETDYRAAIDVLLKAAQNTPQIKSELQLAESQWIFLKLAIERLNANRTSSVELEHVTKACDNIMEVMDRVTVLYERVKV